MQKQTTERLQTGAIFIELQQVDSTNNYATALLHAGMAQPGTAVFAHSQTAGRGQRGKTWVSEPGTSLSLSVIIAPEPLLLAQAFLLSKAVACAARQLIAQYAGEETKIKWPNDIYWCDRKAGGILIENMVQGTVWRAAVAGIGLNINQKKFESGVGVKPVSLKQITGKEFVPLTLARELCLLLTQKLKQMYTDASAITEEYTQHLYKKGEIVQLKKGAVRFAAKIEGVSEGGQLLTTGAVQQVFNVGEVAWVI